MADNKQLEQIVTPGNAEKTRAELAREPQVRDLPWPPPRGWDWHGVGLRIREELADVNRALAEFTGDTIQRATLESHRRRLEQRRTRWKRIVFFAGWRPWHDRDGA